MAEKTRAFRQLTDPQLSAAGSICAGISRATSATVAAGGAGYKVGDTLDVQGGTNLSARAARFRVESINPGGGVASVSLAWPRAGGYTATPAGPVATATNGSGTGCTLNVTWQTPAPPDDSSCALLEVEGANVRVRLDGIAPTTTVGILVTAASSLEVTGKLSDVQVVEVAAGAIVNVTFQR